MRSILINYWVIYVLLVSDGGDDIIAQRESGSI